MKRQVYRLLYSLHVLIEISLVRQIYLYSYILSSMDNIKEASHFVVAFWSNCTTRHDTQAGDYLPILLSLSFFSFVWQRPLQYVSEKDFEGQKLKKNLRSSAGS